MEGGRRGKFGKKLLGEGRRQRMVRGARWWGEGWGLVGVRAGVMVAVGGMLEGRGRGYWFDLSQRLIVHRFLVVVVVVVVIYFAPSADLHRRTGPRGARERRRHLQAAGCRGGPGERRRGVPGWLVGRSAGGWLGRYPPLHLYGWDDKWFWFAEIFFRFSGRPG